MSTFELEALRRLPDEGPVAMLNLLKFRERSLDGDGSGRDAYDRYGRVARGLVEARGGRIVWVGTVEAAALAEGADAEWDAALLVHYPSRGAFLDMVTSAEYLAANVHRSNGLVRHVILATTTRLAEAMPPA